MGTKTEVVYPSVSTFSGTSQLNLGPYNVPSVVVLLRAELRGMVNFQGASLSATSVLANTPLWAVQWVAAGGSPGDVVTSADGASWLMREQLGTESTLTSWAPSTDTAAVLVSYGMRGDWGGQLPVEESIDLYLSMRAPTGASILNMNLFASLRFWWS